MLELIIAICVLGYIGRRISFWLGGGYHHRPPMFGPGPMGPGMHHHPGPMDHGMFGGPMGPGMGGPHGFDGGFGGHAGGFGGHGGGFGGHGGGFGGHGGGFGGGHH